MSAPGVSSLSRFRLESHDHAGNFVTALPYRNLQGEWMMNASGQQIRFEVPYRGSTVSKSNFYPGKHEAWLYDSEVSDKDPIFAGPLWDATASSESGVLSCSAQDPLTYLAKRLLKAYKGYSSQLGTAMMIDLIAYVNSQRVMNLITSVQTAGTGTSSEFYNASDRNVISDLLDAIAKMNDGTDYYMRTINNVHNLVLYGGQIKTAKTLGLEWGGQMDGYSVQYNAQGICNDLDEIGTNGIIGNAFSSAKQTEYSALYQTADSTSNQNTSTGLNATAATGLKDTQSTKTIPSLVTRKLTPIKDFDFGSQFLVSVDDYYVQVNQTIRTIGWQTTVGEGDKLTVVIYTKDSEGVS